MIRAGDHATGYEEGLLAEAIRRSIEGEARVVNLSVAPPAFETNDVTRAIDENRDVLFVISGGNTDESSCNRGTSWLTLSQRPNVMFVGAVTRSTKVYGRYGPLIDIAAPGECIWVATEPPQEIAPLVGASLAAPLVAGVAALLRQTEAFRSCSACEIREILVGAAKPMEGRKGQIANRAEGYLDLSFLEKRGARMARSCGSPGAFPRCNVSNPKVDPC